MFEKHMKSIKNANNVQKECTFHKKKVSPTIMSKRILATHKTTKEEETQMYEDHHNCRTSEQRTKTAHTNL